MIKRIIKATPIWSIIHKLRQQEQARIHRILHNDNTLFYTLSPNLLFGILKAFKIIADCTPSPPPKEAAYYEFGLFKGFSFWFAEQISREYNCQHFKFYGFDSFEGLPQSTVDNDPINWAQGNYAASYAFVADRLKENGTDFSRVKLFKGFFSDEYFNELKSRENLKPAAICVIDSDMYESCNSVLNFISGYLVIGSILLFDDYNAFNKDDNHGERRALKEFKQRNPNFQIQHLFDFGWHGCAFKVTSL